MSNDNEPTVVDRSNPAHDVANKRRASLADLFRPADTTSRTFPSAMSQAQTGSHARRLSISTLGLSGATAQGQPSPFASVRDRGRSLSGDQQQRPNSIYENNESAIAEDGDAVPPLSGTSPTSSGGIRRRLSSGAKAYSDMRRGSGGNTGTSSFPSVAGTNGNTRAAASPPSKRDGFNWSETLRSRAERSSISAGSGNGPNGFASGHSKSPTQPVTAPMNPQPAPPPPAKPMAQKPDAFQERILKGDFYMD